MLTENKSVSQPHRAQFFRNVAPVPAFIWARDERTLPRLKGQFAGLDLLVLDELGYVRERTSSSKTPRPRLDEPSHQPIPRATNLWTKRKSPSNFELKVLLFSTDAPQSPVSIYTDGHKGREEVRRCPMP
jgi:hypothetical protein